MLLLGSFTCSAASRPSLSGARVRGGGSAAAPPPGRFGSETVDRLGGKGRYHAYARRMCMAGMCMEAAVSEVRLR